MEPMLIYVLVCLGALAICAVGAILTPVEKRACPQCSFRIAVSARRCPACSHQLT